MSTHYLGFQGEIRTNIYLEGQQLVQLPQYTKHNSRYSGSVYIKIHYENTPIQIH